LTPFHHARPSVIQCMTTDDCAELILPLFLATTRAHLVTTSAASSKRGRPDADMTDTVALCTVACVRLTTSAISAIKLSRAVVHARPGVALVVIVHSLTRRHYQGTHLRYSFIASFAYRLIRRSLLLLYFRPWEWGSVNTRDSLCSSIYSICVYSLYPVYITCVHSPPPSIPSSWISSSCSGITLLHLFCELLSSWLTVVYLIVQ